MRIGIFWFYRETVLGKAIELSHGEEGVPGLVDSPDNHSDVWDSQGEWSAIFPELRGREYFEVPRGRVLWRKEPASAIIYMDAKLFSDQRKAKIAEYFQLSGCPIQWMTDPHYTTR